MYCDVKGVSADAATVQTLARLQLAARRQGGQIVLRGASIELRRLIDFMGLADVLPVEADPSGEPDPSSEPRSSDVLPVEPGR